MVIYAYWRGLSNRLARGTLIACSGSGDCGGQVQGEACRGLLNEGRVAPFGVVVVEPGRDQIAGMSHRAATGSRPMANGIAARHSRVTSSTTFRMRNRRPQANWSWTKSSDNRALARASIRIGAPVPTALRRALRLRTVTPLRYRAGRCPKVRPGALAR